MKPRDVAFSVRGRLRTRRMARCPYCARPLKGLGLKCRACRRYILRWPHLLVLSLVALIALLFLLEFLLRAA